MAQAKPAAAVPPPAAAAAAPANAQKFDIDSIISRLLEVTIFTHVVAAFLGQSFYGCAGAGSKARQTG